MEGWALRGPDLELKAFQEAKEVPGVAQSYSKGGDEGNLRVLSPPPPRFARPVTLQILLTT